MPDPTIIVVGSVNTDLMLTLPVLPQPGQTVGGGRFATSLGGKGANVAVAAARLGADARLVACIGDDPQGELARRALADAGVDTAAVAAGSAATGIAIVLADERAENLIALASGANDELDATHVQATMREVHGDAVVVANLEVPDDAVLAAARAARAHGWTFILDPAPARDLPAELLALVDVLVPNRGELHALDATGGKRLLDAGVGTVVVTEGPDGARIVTPGGGEKRVPAFRVAASDSTGAGDAFCGALAVELGRGLEIEAAVRRGAAAGALATRETGAQTAFPTRAEVDELCESQQMEV